MKPENWLALQHLAQFSTAFISVFVNSYQLFLIIYKSPKSLIPYKYLMAYTSLSEILYTFFEIVASPCFYTHGSSLIMFIDTRKSLFNPFIISVFNSLYSGAFGSVLGLFSIQFIYRYLNIKQSSLLMSFKSRKIFIWLLIPFLSGLSWSLVVHCFASKTEFKDQYITKSISKDLHIHVDNIIYAGILIYPEDQNGIRHIHLMSLIVNIFISMSMLISLVIILYCGIYCYREIHQLAKTSTSEKSQSLQTQLFYALVIQTMIPMFLLHLPVLTIYLFVLLEINLGIYGGILTITIAIYPAIDPIPNFIIIKEYRNTTKNYINKLLLRKKKPKTENVMLHKLKF